MNFKSSFEDKILILSICASLVESPPSTDLRQVDSNYYVGCSEDYCNFCCLKIINASISIVRYIGIGFEQTDSSFCKEGFMYANYIHTHNQKSSRLHLTLLSFCSVNNEMFEMCCEMQFDWVFTFLLQATCILGSCNVSVDYVVDIDHRTSTTTTTTTTNTLPPPHLPELLCPEGQSLVNDICKETKHDTDDEYDEYDKDDEDDEDDKPTTVAEKKPTFPVGPIPVGYVESRCPSGQIRVDGICTQTVETTTKGARPPEGLMVAYIPLNCPDGMVIVNGKCRTKDER